ncbi:MAG: PepSY domain-containing protein [Burkholderiales bacterium]|nr:PepSY domain-containing protein [Burkholderiales bacterium]
MNTTRLALRHRHRALLAAAALLLAGTGAGATGLATCDSGPKEGWQPQAKLEQMLKDKGWTVRRIKEDGGCYEVYALDDKGQRVEAYFHPVTLAPVPTKPR